MTNSTTSKDFAGVRGSSCSLYSYPLTQLVVVAVVVVAVVVVVVFIPYHTIPFHSGVLPKWLS